MGVKHYDKQFKERAVKLSIQRGNISQVAKELGVSDGQLSIAEGFTACASSVSRAIRR